MGLEHPTPFPSAPRRRRSRAVHAALALAALASLGLGAAHLRASPEPDAPPPSTAAAPRPAPPASPPAPPAAPAALPAPPAAPAPAPGHASRATIPGGALSAVATLGQAKLVRGGDGQLYLHVGIDAAEEGAREHRPIDFSLVLDVSGSMEEQNKLVLLKKATKDLLARLGPEDRVAIVAFSNDARTVFPLAPLGDGERRRAYASAVDELEAGGGTNISAGLLAGAEELRRASPRPGSARRIVLMTDGFANFGVVEPSELSKLVNGLAREGATVSTIGLGLDYAEKVLADMADAGGGAFYDADRPERLARIYEAEVAATRGLVARDARLVVTPASGVAVEEVFLWAAPGSADGTRTLPLGDVSAGRHLKAVARLKVPADAAQGSLDVVSVALRYEDVRGQKGERVATEAVTLAVALEKDAEVARASTANEIRGELDKVVLADSLARAHDLALAGNLDRARACLATVRALNKGDVLTYKALDGTSVSVDLQQLEVACVASSGRGELSEEANACLKRACAGVAPVGK